MISELFCNDSLYYSITFYSSVKVTPVLANAFSPLLSAGASAAEASAGGSAGGAAPSAGGAAPSY